VKNKLRLSVLCLEAEGHLAVALKEMEALVDDHKIKISFLEREGRFFSTINFQLDK
jgi:hypothetical protein